MSWLTLPSKKLASDENQSREERTAETTECLKELRVPAPSKLLLRPYKHKKSGRRDYESLHDFFLLMVVEPKILLRTRTAKFPAPRVGTTLTSFFPPVS